MDQFIPHNITQLLIHPHLVQLLIRQHRNLQTHLAEFPQIDSSLAVPVFKQGDDPVDAINKMMSFLSTVVTSRFPTTNNQLRNFSNPRQQATIHDGSQQRVVKCFNCQGEGHMARQGPKPMRKRDATWFRDKVLLVEAQGSSKVLNEGELEFLANPRVAEGQVTQMVITHNAAYQTDDLDAYDSDCDDFSTAKAILMANLSSYESDVLSEYLLETRNAAVQDINSSTQQDVMILIVFEQLSNQVTNCNKVNKDNLIANESLSAELEKYKERVKLLEERQNMDLSTREKLIMDDIIREKNEQFMDFEKEINYLKQTLYEHLKKKELLTKKFNVFKNQSKAKEAKNIDKEISLENKVKEVENIIRPMLYDGSVIAKETNVISIADSEENLMLEEESRSKMLLKQSDPMVLEKKLQTSHHNTDQSASSPVKIEAPQELPKNNTFVNQTEPTFDHLFELNNLKAELRAKHTTIKKLKANIKRLNKTSTTNSVKKDIDEIKTINIELEHKVAKVIAENEHLKQTYKQLYDSIKPSHVRAKEHAESLVNQLNQKKIKGKDIVDNVAQVSNATTIAPGMYKLDPVTLAPKDKNNRETHIHYLKHTMEQAAILREIVEQAKSLNPLDSAFYSTCKYVKLIQELLGYVRDTCPDIHKLLSQL
ncbi:retrovirus-related pol polyprotein from transposon TNT 1-94 [Tanacetum coccineum]